MAFKLLRIDLHKQTAPWYGDYLQSLKWKDFRVSLGKERGKLCEHCNYHSHDVLHHQTYARLFSEDPEDVVFLCKECHYIEHRDYEIPFMSLIYTPNVEIVKVYLTKTKNNQSKKQKRMSAKR